MPQSNTRLLAFAACLLALLAGCSGSDQAALPNTAPVNAATAAPVDGAATTPVEASTGSSTASETPPESCYSYFCPELTTRGVSGLHGGGPGHIIELSDGRILTAGDVLQLWSLDDPTNPTRLRGFQEGISFEYSAGFELSDNRVALIGRPFSESTKHVLLVDLADPALTEAIDNGERDIAAIAQLADGRIAINDNISIQVWDPTNLDASTADLTGVDNGRFVSQYLAVTADGTALIVHRGGSEEQIYLWDTENEPELIFDVEATFDAKTDIEAVVGLRNGGVAAALDNTTIVLVTPDGSTQLLTGYPPDIDTENHRPRTILELSDGRIATGDNAGVLRVWELANPSQPTIERVSINSLWQLVELRDGRVLASIQTGDPYDSEIEPGEIIFLDLS